MHYVKASQILDLVKGDEGYNVDFKRSVPSKVKEISDEVVGFANASGGYVLIVVDNSNQIIGAEIDNNKRSAIQDTYRRQDLWRTSISAVSQYYFPIPAVFFHWWPKISERRA